VPQDISVMGMDDQRIAGIYDPPLTTIHLPITDLGYNAMVKLARILAGKITKRTWSSYCSRAAQHDRSRPEKSLNRDDAP